MNGLDLALLDLLNFNGGAFFDNLMWYTSYKLTWAPLYIFLLALVIRRKGWRYALWYLLIIIAGVGLADQICNLFKDGLQFLRPNHTPGVAETLHSVRGYKGGLYGTVSAHAALSTVVYLLFGREIGGKAYWWAMGVWLLMTCWSRIYLGAHFPSQVLFGLILGTLLSMLLRWLFLRYIAPRIGNSKCKIQDSK